MDVQTAVIQNALDVCQLFKDNMALTRALPQPNRLNVDKVQAEPAKPVEIVHRIEANTALVQATANAPATPSTPAQPSQPSAAAPGSAGSKYAWLWPAAIAAASTLAGAGGLAGLSYWLLNGEQSTTVNIEQAGDPYLLEYLQEHGYHLPPKGATP